MKILITSIIDLKKSQHNRPHQFVKYLSKKHDVTVLSINDWWKGKQADMCSYSKYFDDIFSRIDYKYLTEKKLNPMLQELFSKKFVQEICENQYDIHLNYNTLISGYHAAIKIPTVFDMADDLAEMIKQSPQLPSILRPFGYYFGNSMIRKNIEISHKITVTNELLMNSYNLSNKNVEIIPNGVDTKSFKKQINAKNELDFRGFTIGYVGVLREWVDLSKIFLAIKKLKDIKIIIVGKEGKFKENKILAKKYDIEDQVIFTGMVPYYEVPKYISAMDVCIIPFKNNLISHNALPLKLFEYMSCERPVISSPLKGVKEVAGNYVLYANSSDEYLTHIQNLRADKDLRAKLGKTGRDFVKSSYDWEKIVNKMEKVLRYCL